MAESELAVPTALADIDAGWLTAALGVRYPGTTVTSVFTGTVITGTATKLRLLLTYDETGHERLLPPTLWLKAGLEAHSGALTSIYAGEAYFYRDLAANLDSGCPIAYFAHVDPDHGRSALLLEDLLARHVKFGNPVNPISIRQASKVLEVLAKLHARYWNDPALTRFAWLANGGALTRSGAIEQLFTPAIWQQAMDLPRSQFAKGWLRNRERVRDALMNLLAEDARNAHCLVHGDAHVGNLCFDQNDVPSYIDWQTVMAGYWAHDVAYFMVTALTIEDRRHSERDLLRHYLAMLTQYRSSASMVVPEFDTAWLDYRRHALYAFGWTLCLPQWQPEEACQACSERACAAIDDLDSLGAW